MSSIRIVVCLSLLIASGTAPAQTAEPLTSTTNCESVSTPHQKKDEDTIRRIEQAWLAAELQGNPKYLECLLEPDYRVSAHDGQIRTRKDLIDRVASVPPSNRDVPKLETIVVVHGDAASAHSILRKIDKDGNPKEIHYVDTFTFHDGRWHAFSGADL